MKTSELDRCIVMRAANELRQDAAVQRGDVQKRWRQKACRQGKHIT